MEVRNVSDSYTVKSNAVLVVTVVRNSDYPMIILKGVKEGTTTITLTDGQNRLATLSVKVIPQIMSLSIIRHDASVETDNPDKINELVVG